MKKTIIILFAVFISGQIFAQKGKYKVENAIIEYEMNLMGTVTKIPLYISNYGEKECTEASIKMFGMSKTTRNLTLGDFVYVLDMEEKKGTKTSISEVEKKDVSKEIDFDNPTKEQIEKYKLEKVGKEDFLNKSCDVYTVISNESNIKLWVWKNIPLKTETSLMGMTVKLEAVRVDENPTFPKGIFEVPADFKITEIEDGE